MSDRTGAQADRFYGPRINQANTRERVLHEGLSADCQPRGRIFSGCVWHTEMTPVDVGLYPRSFSRDSLPLRFFSCGMLMFFHTLFV